LGGGFRFPSLLRSIFVGRKVRVAFFAQCQVDDVGIPTVTGVFEQGGACREFYVGSVSANRHDARSFVHLPSLRRLLFVADLIVADSHSKHYG
jgi:hypothetical protein